jgi:hypothetical protein
MRDGLAKRERPELADAVLEYPVDRPGGGDGPGAKTHAVEDKGRREHCSRGQGGRSFED